MEGSLRGRLEARDLYSVDPKNLADYDFDRARILHREVHPRPIKDGLPAYARGYYDHHEDLIQKDEAELEVDREARHSFQPYWGPRLRQSRAERMRRFRRFHEQGLLCFRRRIMAHASMLFVKQIGGFQRMIVDARAAKACHRPPPSTRLGSVRCMADLEISDPR